MKRQPMKPAPIPKTPMKQSANALRFKRIGRSTKPRAKEHAFLQIADRVEEMRTLLNAFETDLLDWASLLDHAREVGDAVVAAQAVTSNGRFRRLQQLADEIVGIGSVAAGGR